MKRGLTFLGIVAVILFSFQTAFGSGFALIEQSVSGLGNAFAGGAAAAEDASTVYFNPAGMTRLQGQQLLFAGHYISAQAEFKNEGSTHVLGMPLTGGNSGNAPDANVAPNFYYVVNLDNGLAFGLGINAPFGFTTDYDTTWVGRYHALKSSVISANINPSVAYRFSPRFSLGGGLNIQYLEAELSNAVDFGTIDVASMGGSLGLTPQQDDGKANLAGDNWAYGFNLGALLEISDNTRLGVAYRSSIQHDIKGKVDYNVPLAIAYAQTMGLNMFTDGPAAASINLPDTFSISFYHRFAEKWAVMADATWTRWSLFDELKATFDDDTPDSVTTENWEDTWRYALGLTYYANENWTFRTGAAFDETPVPDAQHRTPRIPCGDRIWAAFGLGYKISENFGIDIGYAHLFVDDPEINKTATGEDQLRGALQGTFDASVDILSVQLNIAF